jgi:hypothetical protein
VFLTAYHFDGDPIELVAAHQRLLEHFPLDTLDLHLCVTTATGIVVFDACPSRAVHDQFSRSPQFLGAVAAAGLPAPRIEPLGDIHLAHLRERATT